MKKILAVVVSCILLASFGCANKNGNYSISQLTEESLERDLIKGQTTQAEARAKFGEPTLMQRWGEMVKGKMMDGSVWVYTYSESKADGREYIPYVGVLLDKNQASKGKQLQLYFNENKILERYFFGTSAHDSTQSLN